jgi:hypothetical protein
MILECESLLSPYFLLEANTLFFTLMSWMLQP